MDIIITKKCTKCGVEKSLDGFALDFRTKDGHVSACKVCKNHYEKGYNKKNRDKINEYNKKYYYDNLEYNRTRSKKYRSFHRNRLIEYIKDWRSKNKDKTKEYGRRNWTEHRDEILKYIRNWHKLNPSKNQVYGNNRRVRKLSNGGTFSSDEWIMLCNKYGNKCLCCERTDVKLTVDHVIPIVKGGRNSIDNIQPLCKSCNSKKGMKIIDYRGVI